MFQVEILFKYIFSLLTFSKKFKFNKTKCIYNLSYLTNKLYILISLFF